MFEGLKPKPRLSEAEVERGLAFLVRDGVYTEAMGALTGGALLVGFALLLGASNTTIGIIAAAGPLTKILQLPATLLVERLRRRKALVFWGLLARRLVWVPIALLPFIVTQEARELLFVGLLVIYFGVGSISACALSSWVRDLVPDDRVGRFFARRLTAATAVGALLTLAGGVAIDFGAHLFGDAARAYAAVFGVAVVLGLMGTAAVAQIPEPEMGPSPGGSLWTLLREPLRERNFVNLLAFLGTWSFAVNLVAPFFVVYMLTRIGLPMTWVLGLSVVSQVFNLAFFRIWGRLADRFSNKAVLAISGGLFVVTFVMWPFTTLPTPHPMTLPLLLLIHILAGISTSGVSLCASGIAVKLAPRGQSTAFLATNALVNGVAATAAPVVAGVVADRLVDESLTLQFRWTTAGDSTRVAFDAMSVQGHDFLFIVAILIGLFALHRLALVREAGEAGDALQASEVYAEVLRTFRHVSNVAGIRHLTHFPFALLRQLARRRHPDSPPGLPPEDPPRGDG